MKLRVIMMKSAVFFFLASILDVSYDKFDHITKVSTAPLEVSNAIGRNQQKQDLRLQVLYECVGETSHCRPNSVELRFVSYSAGEYTGSDQLVFIAGGKRVRLGVNWAGAYERRPPVELVSAAINLEEFLELAKADKVEGRLGGTTFTLNGDNFASLRALATEIGSVRDE